jgi:hypothetical protein
VPEPHWSGREPQPNQGPPGPAGPAGASTLAELTDVTGSSAAGCSPVNDGSTESPWTRVTTQEDLDAILASVAHVDWRTLQLQPGFAPYGEDFADPRYRLTLNNVVHIEGMVACTPPLSDTDVGKIIATVDTDSLPGGRLLFSGPAYGNSARIDISPTGDIAFQGMLIGGGQIDWLSLSMINYSVGTNANVVITNALAEVFA